MFGRSEAGRWFFASLGLLFLTIPDAVFAQTREREVTITGPRGRTIDRQFHSTVTPGGIDRRTTITRPGGTFSREVQIARPPAPAYRPLPGPARPGGNVYIERDVIVGGGRAGISGAEAFGIGALGAAVGTGAGYLMGRAVAPPPPPPVIVSPPVVVAGPPMVAAAPAVVAAPPTVIYQQAAPPPDQVTQAMTRLASRHDNSRKEAAYVLGRLGDSRAVPALVDILKNDRNKDVKIAAANAIAQIGDPSSAIYLERASIYDKRPEVRDAAAAALARMPRELPAPAQQVHRNPVNPTRSAEPEIQPFENPPPPPTPVNPGGRGNIRGN